MSSFKLRIKSARAPYRRAGVAFAEARQWQEVVFEDDGSDELTASKIDAMKRILALVSDPVLVVELWDDAAFVKAPSDVEVKAYIEKLEASQIEPENFVSELQAAAVVNANLPPVGRTLEGEDTSDKPPESESQQEAAAISDAPGAESAPAPAEGVPAIPPVATEAAPETQPKPVKGGHKAPPKQP